MKPITSLDPAEAQDRLDAFDTILIAHPRMGDAHARLDSLAMQTRSRVAQYDVRLENAKGRPIKSAELWIQPLVGPSGAGKSASLSSYVEKCYNDPKTQADCIPALIVTLRSSTRTPRQLQAQILEAYKDPSAPRVLTERDYSEAVVNDALRAIARKRQTYIVILDEAHNLYTGGLHAREVMTKAFKSLVNDGLFSLVLAGTDQMVPLLNYDPEIKSRQKEKIDFGRLERSRSDLTYFFDFVAYLEQEMVDRRVIDGPVGLTASAEECGVVYDMADGVVGIVSRVLRLALERAFLGGETRLSWEHITHAFRAWKEASEDEDDEETINRYDPFVAGVRPQTQEAVNEALSP